MSTPNDGGPAFPCESNIIMNGKQATVPAQGITVRDYFAAAALQGRLARCGHSGRWSDMAQYSYDAADAMLKQRRLTKEPQS